MGLEAAPRRWRPDPDRDPSAACFAYPELRDALVNDRFAYPELRGALVNDGSRAELAAARTTLLLRTEPNSALWDALRSCGADRDSVWTAVSLNGEALRWAPPHLQKDSALVRTAVTNRGSALEWASPALRAERLIVKAAIRNDPSALLFASTDLRHELELEALRQAQWLGECPAARAPWCRSRMSCLSDEIRRQECRRRHVIPLPGPAATEGLLLPLPAAVVEPGVAEDGAAEPRA